MPLMEPGSSWASTHGEKTSIPTTRIDLAKFGIGKLLSCERLTPNSSANCPVPSHLERILRASRTKSSSKDAACPWRIANRTFLESPKTAGPLILVRYWSVPCIRGRACAGTLDVKILRCLMKIRFVSAARPQLRGFSASGRTRLVDSIEVQLSHEPEVETRMKTLELRKASRPLADYASDLGSDSL